MMAMMRGLRVVLVASFMAHPAMAQHMTGYMAEHAQPWAPVFPQTVFAPTMVLPQSPVVPFMPPVPVYEAPVSHVTNCTTVWVAPFQMMSCY